MKRINENGRLFGKLHLFDLLILILLLVGIVGMALRFVGSDDGVITPRSATYTVEFVEKDEYFTTAYAIGDTLYEKSENMGTVTNVEVRPHQSVEVLPDGTSGLVEHVTTYDIILTVETDNLREHDGYFIGSQEFLNGTGHTLSNGFAAAGGTVRAITIKE
ncbi:MAG: DUF4330 domain-containing protein [Clostridia bacterium]|nr:DUF4330 domain-containing protein [Clostridia bacterium]